MKYITNPSEAVIKLLQDANTVEEGLLIEELVAEIDRLSKCKLVCPICKQELVPVNYKGYYDSFSFYECGCEHFDNAAESKGSYTY